MTVNIEKIDNSNPAKPRGRPIAFNQEEALDKALTVFWTHGYEGATMTELTQALGVNKPSIYATYGNKEALFRKALTRYVAGPAAFIREALDAPTAQLAVQELLHRAVDFFTDKSTPNGCMIVQGALTCGESASEIQQTLIEYRMHFEDGLSKRFELAKKQGDLPTHVECKQLAKYIATIHQGLSVQASSGATREELLCVVKMAISHWPYI